MHTSLPAARRARRLLRVPSAAVAAAVFFAPALAIACACGCGIFDVGGVSGIMPDYSEGPWSVYFRYDYMNQNQNWEGDHQAAAADNGDKELMTSFYTFGGQYRVNLDWTVMAELPVYDRHLTTTDDGTIQGPPGSIFTGKIFTPGDLELMADYTGLSPNLATGLIFGVKLPTGDWHGPKGPLGGYEFDRDSLPGTGTTDLILGAYHNGALTADGKVGYYVQGRVNIPLNTQGGYRPGTEYDAAIGTDYNFEQVGPFRSVAPVLSILGSIRAHDSGPAADYLNSGYARLFVAPGVQLQYKNFRIYADLEVPFYQHTNSASSVYVEGTAGQLIASPLFKVQVNYDF
jgi:hypothetical protein